MTDRLSAALAGRYTIERELGAGGMATVYLAEDAKHHRKVALKVLRPELAQALGSERFLREVETTAQLHHPHILPLYDSGEAGGFLYYVMPYVEGESLRDRLARDTELPVSEAVRILRDVVDALSHAHQRGVVHRDIKPDNVMLSGNHAFVTDFGVAKAVSEATGRPHMTTAGVALGTPTYMAPEQASGDPHIDHRVDIYAVGIVAYELLTGRPPFAGKTVQSLLAAHIADEPEHVSTRRRAVPPALADAVMQCLEKKPADRFQTAAELLHRLETLVTPSSGTEPTPARGRGSGRFALLRNAAAVGGVIGLVAIGLALWLAADRTGGSAGGAERAPPSLAVLPFADLSPERDQEYLGDGIAETLISTLSKIQGLRVAARTSAFSFKGRNEDVRTIAEQLGVSSLLEGTVQRSGARLRITAQLVDAKDGFHVWSQTFDRDLDDVFAVQDEVARAVVQALQIELIGDAESRLGTHATENVDAYNAYLLGRYHWNERTGEALERAAEHFERAIASDSQYALAWSGLADTYVLFPQYHPGSLPFDEALGRAERAARRAIALDRSIAAPHATLALLFESKWSMAEADRAFQQALAVDSTYATAHQWYASYLLSVGRTGEAVRSIRKAERLDPLSRIIGLWVALVLDAAGQHDGAGEQYQKVLRLDPNVGRIHRDAWLHYLRSGDYNQAGVHLARFVELSGEPRAVAESWRQRVVTPATRPAALRAIADSILGGGVATALSVVPYGSASIAAEVLAILGERDRAADLLQKSYRAPGIGADPSALSAYVLNRDLRADPRFRALLDRIGMR